MTSDQEGTGGRKLIRERGATSDVACALHLESRFVGVRGSMASVLATSAGIFPRRAKKDFGTDPVS